MQTTIIIPTSTAPFKCLERCILSLIKRSDFSKIDQIIVSINGPDIRTGDPTLQDQKEAFCRTLDKTTVIRSWSRVGQGPAISICLPLVKTDNYVIMHDDVIVLSDNWQKEAEYWLAKEEIVGVITPPVLSPKLTTSVFRCDNKTGTTITYLATLNTTFSIFKTSANLNWDSYHCKVLDKNIDLSSINSFYEKLPKSYTILYDSDFKQNVWKKTRIVFPDNKPEIIQYDCGAWAAYSVLKNHKIATFSKNIHHIKAMSTKNTALWETDYPDGITSNFLEEIGEKQSKLDFSAIKPLICVLVYDRIDNISYWIKAWKKSNHYNGKLLIVQNVNDSEKSREISSKIQSLKPDIFLHRKNDKQSTKHWFELLDIDIGFDWNVLLTFTDDCIPLRKDFLMPFMHGFATKPNLGLIGGALANYERHQIAEYNYFQRGICLGIKKEALQKVEKLAFEPSISGFSYNCEENIWKWMKKHEYEVSCTDYEWSLIFGWDCDNQGINDLWEESEFNIFESESKLYEFS